jgi:hypothetical protein
MILNAHSAAKMRVAPRAGISSRAQNKAWEYSYLQVTHIFLSRCRFQVRGGPQGAPLK